MGRHSFTLHRQMLQRESINLYNPMYACILESITATVRTSCRCSIFNREWGSLSNRSRTVLNSVVFVRYLYQIGRAYKVMRRIWKMKDVDTQFMHLKVKLQLRWDKIFKTLAIAHEKGKKINKTRISTLRLNLARQFIGTTSGKVTKPNYNAKLDRKNVKCVVLKPLKIYCMSWETVHAKMLEISMQKIYLQT